MKCQTRVTRHDYHISTVQEKGLGAEVLTLATNEEDGGLTKAKCEIGYIRGGEISQCQRHT